MKQSAGEFLADVAESASGPRVALCEAGEDMDTALAVVKLALVLRGHPNLQFRSIVEDWDLQRVVRELY